MAPDAYCSVHVVKKPPVLVTPGALPLFLGVEKFARTDDGEESFRLYTGRLLEDYGLSRDRRDEIGLALTEVFVNARFHSAPRRPGRASRQEPVYVAPTLLGPLLDFGVVADRHRGVDRNKLVVREGYVLGGERRHWGTRLGNEYLDGLFYNDPETMVDVHCVVNLERRFTDEELALQKPN